MTKRHRSMKTTSSSVLCPDFVLRSAARTRSLVHYGQPFPNGETMFNRKTVILITLLTMVALAIGGATMIGAQDPSGQPAPAKAQVVPLMRLKLDRAKNILEGLTLEEFDKIASNARSLRLLSTEAGWNIIQTEEYRKQSEAFRRACDSIEKAAKGKDVHRAALSYVALTVRCVECHSYMRENKIKIASGHRGGKIPR